MGHLGANRGKIIDDFRGTIEFGGNWTSPCDEMPFELHYGEGHAGTEALADDLRNGLWGIFGAGTAPTPGIELPSGEDYLDLGDSGDDVLALQRGMNVVLPKYKTTPVAEDGDFGPLTQAAGQGIPEKRGPRRRQRRLPAHPRCDEAERTRPQHPPRKAPQ